MPEPLDGSLAAEETACIIGWDSGEWFLRPSGLKDRHVFARADGQNTAPPNAARRHPYQRTGKAYICSLLRRHGRFRLRRTAAQSTPLLARPRELESRNLIYGTGWAGWGFESNCTASAANATPVSVLRDAPIFEHDPACMFTNVISQANIDNILIKGIPALSWPLGKKAISFPIGTTGQRNIDMNAKTTDPTGIERPNGWPIDAEYDYGDRWLHSQVINVAHFYTHKLYQMFVDLGGLK